MYPLSTGFFHFRPRKSLAISQWVRSNIISSGPLRLLQQPIYLGLISASPFTLIILILILYYWQQKILLMWKTMVIILKAITSVVALHVEQKPYKRVHTNVRSGLPCPTVAGPFRDNTCYHLHIDNSFLLYCIPSYIV